MGIKFYIHSRCCGMHWELVYTDKGEYDLQCENCGKSAGIKFYPPTHKFKYESCKNENE